MNNTKNTTNNVLEQAVVYNKKRSRKKLWYRIVSMLSAFVVFVTTYALILPAITLSDDPICGKVEHVHCEECFKTEYTVEFTCLSAFHSHSDTCYSDDVLICRKTAFVIHSHSDVCFDGNGNLICSLPEIETHIHSEDCFSSETDAETVTSAIVENNSDEENVEYTTAAEITEPSTEEIITENAESLTSETETLNEKTEAVEETTSEEIQETVTEPETMAEVESEPMSEPEPESVTENSDNISHHCDKEEIVIHVHGETCSDENGELICELPEVFEHSHTSQCIKKDETEKTVCTFEEHTHDEIICYKKNLADIETSEQWEASLPKELTEDWIADFTAVALSQVGYSESNINVRVGASGEMMHYSRYGAWNGQPYSDWNYLFVAFCLHYADIPTEYIPQADTLEEFIEKVSETEFKTEGAEEIKKGDIVFFKDSPETVAVGIATDFKIKEDASRNPVVVCGDYNGTVSEIDCDTQTIQYYISLSDAYNKFCENENVNNENSERTIIVNGDDYIVTVCFDDTTGIPENAQLFVEEVTEKESEIDYFTDAKNVISESHESEVAFSHMRLFDIGFYLDGEKIEPADGSSVRVNITFTDNFELTKSETLDVVHFGDDGSAELINSVMSGRVELPAKENTAQEDLLSSPTDNSGISVAFETDGFSVFAVAAADASPLALAAAGQYSLNPTVFWMYRSQKDSHFYWRFREQTAGGDWLAYPGSDGIGSASEEQNNLTEDGQPIVTVTYSNSNSDSGAVPYYSYQDSLVSGNYNKMLPLDEILATEGMFYLDGDNWTKIKIETAEGYVVTSYSINCEWGTSDGSEKVGSGYRPGVQLANNKAENCQTAITNDNQVDVDPTGQYSSSFYVDGHENTVASTDNSTLADAITETDCGHLSWGIAGVNYRYVLLIEVARVNFEIDIQKSAAPEMVVAGDSVTYTAVADFPSEKATEGVTYMTNVVFTDEFFNSSTIASVKYISKDGTTYNLTASSSVATGSSGPPQSYYLNKTEGKIYINSSGQWEKDGRFEIVYDYKTNSNISNTQTLTNTIFCVGTFDGAQRKAYAVANVSVIVNSTQKGSIRIYKTFEGLTHDEIYDIILNNSPSFKLQVLQNGTPISVSIRGENNVLKQVKELTVANYGIRYYSDGENYITYYADILNLNQNSNYSVAELNFLYGDYVWKGTYSINGGSFSELSADGKTSAFSVLKGSSASVEIKNTYGNTVDLIVRKIGQMSEALGGAKFLLQIDNNGVWEDIERFTVELDGDVAQYVISELTSGFYRLTEEEAPTGYNLLLRPIEFTIDSGQLDMGDKQSDNVVFSEENGIFVITVRNMTGYELPDTGASGTTLYTLGGSLLIISALGSLLYNTIKRRKEDFASS